MRRPMDVALLLDYNVGLMAKPPLPPDYPEIYNIVVSSDGQILMEIWRSEYVKTIQDVAIQPTWSLQKKLLWHLVKETGWLALGDVIVEGHDLRSWSAFVEEVDFFYDVDDRQRLSLLTQRRLLAMLTRALLYVTGMAAYGLTEKHQSALNLYKVYRQIYISLFVNFLEDYRIIQQKDAYKAEHLYRNNSALKVLIRDFHASTVSFGESIVEGNFDLRQAYRKFTDINCMVNNTLTELGIGHLMETNQKDS